MAKNTFIVSDDSLNDYGFRVLTSGIDFTQFERNPIMMLMHKRHDKEDTGVIGRWENLRIENNQLLADAVFDESDKLGAKISKKVKDGFIRMASIGVAPIETSVKPVDLLDGQEFPTVTKSKLIEISIVDRGSNDNAIKLYGNDQKDFQLNAIEQIENNKPNINTKMDKIKEELGLSASATDSEVLAKIQTLNLSAGKLKTFQDEQKETRRLSAESQLKELNLSAEDTVEYMELAKTNFGVFEKTVKRIKLASDSKTVSKFVGGLKQEKSSTGEKLDLKSKDYDWLSKNNPKYLAELKSTDPEAFKTLFNQYINS